MPTIKEVLAFPDFKQKVTDSIQSYLLYSISFLPPIFFSYQANFSIISGGKTLLSLIGESFFDQPFSTLFKLPIILVLTPLAACYGAYDRFLIRALSRGTDDLFYTLNAMSALLVMPLCYMLYTHCPKDTFSTLSDFISHFYIKYQTKLSKNECEALIQGLAQLHQAHPEIFSENNFDESEFLKAVVALDNQALINALIKLLIDQPKLLDRLEALVAQSGAFPLRSHRCLLWQSARALSQQVIIKDDTVQPKQALFNHTSPGKLEMLNGSPHLLLYLQKAKPFTQVKRTLQEPPSQPSSTKPAL